MDETRDVAVVIGSPRRDLWGSDTCRSTIRTVTRIATRHGSMQSMALGQGGLETDRSRKFLKDVVPRRLAGGSW